MPNTFHPSIPMELLGPPTTLLLNPATHPHVMRPRLVIEAAVVFRLCAFALSGDVQRTAEPWLIR